MHHPRFGPVLKVLIDRDFPSQVAFARRVGLSPARISQLVHEADPNVTYPVLADILPAFEPLDQISLYEAWLRSHAPAPTGIHREAPKTDDEIENFLKDCINRIGNGQGREVARELRKLNQTLTRAGRLSLAFQAGAMLAETLFALDRRAEGLHVSDEMIELATKSQESLLVADSLRLKAVGLRPLDVTGRFGAAAAFRAYASFLDSTLRYGDVQAWKNHESSLTRDQALLAWELSRRGQPDENLNDHAEQSIRREIIANDHPTGVFLALEVGSRVALAQGDIDRAERLLDRAMRSRQTSRVQSADVKVDVTKIRVLVAKGEFDRAIEGASSILDRMDDFGLLHYHRELTSLISSIRKTSKHPRVLQVGIR